MTRDDDADLPLRPNLGPEPWPDADGPSAWWTLLALPVFGLVAWRLARMRRATVTVDARDSSGGDELALTPTQRFARLADNVRDRLAERFGPGWAAMTTEELQVALKETISATTFPVDDCVSLFRAADQAKFADWPVTDDHLAVAEAAAARVLAALAAGAMIKENGR